MNKTPEYIWVDSMFDAAEGNGLFGVSFMRNHVDWLDTKIANEIMTAIGALKSPQGATTKDICDYLSKRYSEDKINRMLHILSSESYVTSDSRNATVRWFFKHKVEHV